jgi:hypothetical protein
MITCIHACTHERDGGPPGLSCCVYGVRDSVGGTIAGMPVTGRLPGAPERPAAAAGLARPRRPFRGGWPRWSAARRDGCQDPSGGRGGALEGCGGQDGPGVVSSGALSSRARWASPGAAGEVPAGSAPGRGGQGCSRATRQDTRTDMDKGYILVHSGRPGQGPGIGSAAARIIATREPARPL